MGFFLVAEHSLPFVVASLVAKQWALGHVGFSGCVSRALEHRLSSCSAQTQLLRGLWDLLDSPPLSYKGSPAPWFLLSQPFTEA